MNENEIERQFAFGEWLWFGIDGANCGIKRETNRWTVSTMFYVVQRGTSIWIQSSVFTHSFLSCFASESNWRIQWQRTHQSRQTQLWAISLRTDSTNWLEYRCGGVWQRCTQFVSVHVHSFIFPNCEAIGWRDENVLRWRAFDITYIIVEVFGKRKPIKYKLFFRSHGISIDVMCSALWSIWTTHQSHRQRQWRRRRQRQRLRERSIEQWRCVSLFTCTAKCIETKSLDAIILSTSLSHLAIISTPPNQTNTTQRIDVRWRRERIASHVPTVHRVYTSTSVTQCLSSHSFCTLYYPFCESFMCCACAVALCNHFICNITSSPNSNSSHWMRRTMCRVSHEIYVSFALFRRRA